MKKKKHIAVLLILALLITGGYYWFAKYRLKNSLAGVLEASGTIEADMVDVRAKVSGSLEKTVFEEGDEVKRGELMAQLSRPDLEAQGERDAMGVLAAEAKLNDLLSGARNQEIKQVMTSVDMAKASLEKAETDWKRLNELYEAGAVAKETVEKAYTDLVIKQKQLEAAEAQLSLVKEGNRSGQISIAEAELKRAKAVLSTSEAILEDLKVLAPISGVVLSKNFTAGEFVTAGMSIYTVADLNNLWINVYIPTDDLPRVKLGQQVECTVSGSNKVYAGTVVKIADKGEFTPKTIQTKKERTNVVFAVKVAIKNEDNDLKPGMPVDVVFAGGE